MFDWFNLMFLKKERKFDIKKPLYCPLSNKMHLTGGRN